MSVIPVAERIEEKVFKRLQQLEAGFYIGIDPPQVMRPTRHGDDAPEHNQIILETDDPERMTEHDCPGNPPATGWGLRFRVRCRVMPSENDVTAVNTFRNELSAAVRAVLTTPNASYHTWDSLAFNTVWESPTHITGDSFFGIVIPFIVLYRTSEWDLCEVRA